MTLKMKAAWLSTHQYSLVYDEQNNKTSERIKDLTIDLMWREY